MLNSNGIYIYIVTKQIQLFFSKKYTLCFNFNLTKNNNVNIITNIYKIETRVFYLSYSFYSFKQKKFCNIYLFQCRLLI